MQSLNNVLDIKTADGVFIYWHAAHFVLDFIMYNQD